MKVRIALVVNGNGRYAANGWAGASDADMMGTALDCLDAEGPEARYFVTVEVPQPEVTEIEGSVEAVEEGAA